MQNNKASGLKLNVNGKEIQSQAKNLADLCEELGFLNQKIATAVNLEFVPALQRQTTMLKENDSVEIVSPRQGG